jgi:LemA protein
VTTGGFHREHGVADTRPRPARRRPSPATITATVAGALALCVLVLIWTHNVIVKRAEQVEAAWAQVETQLQRRADLVPALVRVTERHAELDVHLRTRTHVEGEVRLQSRDMPAPATSEISRALEAQLAGAENRLAIARWRHHQAVTRYNATLRTLPGRIVASIRKLEPRPYQ